MSALEAQRVARRLREHGISVEEGGRHLKLVSSDGRFLGTMSRSPSDHRWKRNLRSQLRRHGIEVGRL